MSKHAVSLRDIATHLKVSVATVSMALNHYPNISRSTTRRVLEAAKEMGYRPNPLMSQLAAGQWRPTKDTSLTTIAFMRYDKQCRARDHPWTEALNGALDEAQSKGYQLETFNLMDYPSPDALDRVLFSRGIKGIIIGRTFDRVPRITMKWNRYAVVCCGTSCYPLPFNGVSPNYFNMIELATNRLRKLGYRKIGAVLFALKVSMLDDDLRIGSVLAQNQKLESRYIVPPLVSTMPSPEVVLEWYQAHRPEAIIGMNAFACEALTRWSGLRCPQDFAFASLSVGTNDSHSGLRSMDYRLGSTSVQFLINQLKENQYGPARFPLWHELEPEWVDRGTCPALRPKKDHRHSKV